MTKYEVLHGRHSEGSHKDKNGREVFTIYQQGDIVDSKSDLVAMFNSPGCEKFKRIYEEPVAPSGSKKSKVGV